MSALCSGCRIDEKRQGSAEYTGTGAKRRVTEKMTFLTLLSQTRFNVSLRPSQVGRVSAFKSGSAEIVEKHMQSRGLDKRREAFFRFQELAGPVEISNLASKSDLE